MKDNKKALLEATENLKDSFRYFIEVLENIEHDGKDINDIIVDKYPLDKDLYEFYIDLLDWTESIENKSL